MRSRALAACAALVVSAALASCAVQVPPATVDPGPVVGTIGSQPSAPSTDPGASRTADPGGPDPGGSDAPGADSSSAPVVAGAALTVLARLPVKGRAPMTGYARSQFGGRWPDVDRNGCDTRNDILARDLRGIVRKSDGCTVLTGVLADPYTGGTVRFVRGAATSALVQIDHVVALGDAWQKGAQRLTRARRIALANDPLELLAVDGASNERKSAGDAATWLPPATAYRCAYVARQIAVKAKYSLWVTAAERDAMRRVLSRCPGQRLPRG